MAATAAAAAVVFGAALVVLGLVPPTAGSGLAGATAPSSGSSHGSRSHDARAKTPVVRAPTRRSRTAHVAFWECPAKSTSVLVAVDALVLHPGQTLHLSFIAKNLGQAACSYVAPYAGVVPGPTAAALAMGPCGSLPFVVDNKHGHNVWPGTAAFACPALGYAQLASGQVVQGTGSWDLTRGGSTAHVPPGTYTVVVDKVLRIPLRVTAG
jgi:hypothetical protein